jgi:hypothetical protein
MPMSGIWEETYYQRPYARDKMMEGHACTRFS